MICPGSHAACDNPGCRRGGCQGRPPEPPLLQLMGLDQPFAAVRRIGDDNDAMASVVGRQPVAA